MYRLSRLRALSVAAAVLPLLTSVAFAHQEPQTGTTAADPEAAARRERMQDALQRATPLLSADPTLKPLLPVLTQIMDRAATDLNALSQDELEIAQTVIEMGGRGGDLDLDALSALRAKVRKNITHMAAAKPAVVVGENKVPGAAATASGSSKIGYVRLKVGSRSTVVAEIPSSAGNLSPVERARQVAARIQTASTKDPLWHIKAKPALRNGLWVVACPSAPDGYLLTCDPAFAKLRQTSPQTLANRVASRIRITLGGPNELATSRFGPEGEDEEDAASEARIAGDTAYASGNKTVALAKYREALESRADYVTAHERLCAMYAETGDKANLTKAATAALALPGLTIAQKATFQAYLK